MTCNTFTTNYNLRSNSMLNWIRMVRYYLRCGHNLMTAIKLTRERSNEFKQYRHRKY